MAVSRYSQFQLLSSARIIFRGKSSLSGRLGFWTLILLLLFQFLAWFRPLCQENLGGSGRMARSGWPSFVIRAPFGLLLLLVPKDLRGEERVQMLLAYTSIGDKRASEYKDFYPWKNLDAHWARVPFDDLSLRLL